MEKINAKKIGKFIGMPVGLSTVVSLYRLLMISNFRVRPPQNDLFFKVVQIMKLTYLLTYLITYLIT